MCSLETSKIIIEKCSTKKNGRYICCFLFHLGSVQWSLTETIINSELRYTIIEPIITTNNTLRECEINVRQ